jgi:outer membrane lipoprotein-sorting protein
MRGVVGRSFLIAAGLLLAASAPARAEGPALSDLELLRRADALASYPDADFSADYAITQYKPGQSGSTTAAKVYRRDSIETYVIVIQSPAVSRGQGYLKQGKTLWFYDPQSRRFNTTSSADRFQNTNARNSDFTRSTLAEDYRILGGEDAALGSLTCRLLTLEAATTEVTYPRMKIWIGPDGLVRQTQDYSLSGQLLRTGAIPEYYRVGERYVPKRILFEDALKGAVIDGKMVRERTQISVANPSFAQRPDSTYSKTYLESVSK